MAKIAVLLVDDEEDFRFIFIRQIKRFFLIRNLSFLKPETAKKALELLRTGIKPSIIILDYTMPKMSGTELLRTIDREHGNLLHVPRVVLSRYIGEDAIREVESLRCDYIEKEHKHESLLSAVLPVSYGKTGAFLQTDDPVKNCAVESRRGKDA